MKKIVIIDYGLSNLKSVKRAFEYMGAEVEITGEAKVIASAEKLVLPGVGAFEDGMKGLRNLGLIERIQERAKEGIPLLGICLGMQMLLEESDEMGIHTGLGLIPGRVEKISLLDVEGNKQCVPNVGWRKLRIPFGKEEFEHAILDKSFIGEETYFVHSFEAKCKEMKHCIAVAEYGGREVSAVIAKGNVIGMQFHPEKSGKIGLRMVKRFIQL